MRHDLARAAVDPDLATGAVDRVLHGLLPTIGVGGKQDVEPDVRVGLAVADLDDARLGAAKTSVVLLVNGDVRLLVVAGFDFCSSPT